MKRDVHGLLSENAFAFPKCDDDPTPNVGIVWIDLPERPFGKLQGRFVRHRWGRIDENSAEDSQMTGSKPNAPTNPEPLSIYLENVRRPLPSSGYLAVHVRIAKNFAYKFHDESGVHGVGAEDPSSKVLCVAKVTSGNDIASHPGFWVSRFFVDLSRVPAGHSFDAYFNVIIHRDGLSNRPYWIDPKVHNEG